MNRTSWLCAWLAGCSCNPPVVTSVTPTEAMPGDAFTISGEPFEEGVQVSLAVGEQRFTVPVKSAGEGRLDGDLPADLPPAQWRVVVTGEAGDAVMQPSIDVWTADTEPPCTKRYALSTETLGQRKVLTVERTFRDRPGTVQTWAADAIAGLELASTPLADGTPCAALWLRDKDGHTVLLADDTARSLEPQAAAMAEALGVPLQGVASAAP